MIKQTNKSQKIYSNYSSKNDVQNMMNNMRFGFKRYCKCDVTIRKWSNDGLCYTCFRNYKTYKLSENVPLLK
jgi:hypothetical protein